jgi:hypothetical protein
MVVLEVARFEIGQIGFHDGSETSRSGPAQIRSQALRLDSLNRGCLKLEGVAMVISDYWIGYVDEQGSQRRGSMANSLRLICSSPVSDCGETAVILHPLQYYFVVAERADSMTPDRRMSIEHVQDQNDEFNISTG